MTTSYNTQGKVAQPTIVAAAFAESPNDYRGEMGTYIYFLPLYFGLYTFKESLNKVGDPGDT
jgi:hypothetical protein